MRPRLPRYVQVVRAKGFDYLYFRRHGQRWRLPGDAASAEFQKAYLELLAKTDIDPAPRRLGEGSVAALIRDYRSSDEFLNLRPKTQRDYGRMLEIFAPIDHHPADAVRRRHIRELRKTFAGKGRTQQLFSQVASLLFNFAVDNDYCETNPASRLKRIGKASAYKAWSDADCAAFEASGPPRHVMTGYMLGRYTGQRRGDVLKMARRAYGGGLIAVKPSKTERHADDNEQLFIPAHKRLRTYLAELPMDALLFVVDADGLAINETAFSKDFRAALDGRGSTTSTSMASGIPPEQRSPRRGAARKRLRRCSGTKRSQWFRSTRRARAGSELQRAPSPSSKAAEQEQNGKVANLTSKVANFDGYDVI